MKINYNKNFLYKIIRASIIIILSFVINLAIPLPGLAPNQINKCNARSGCCSWHGGVNGCDYDTGRQVCNDGTYSPSCGCSIIPKPYCKITAYPSKITWGQSTILRWTSSPGVYSVSSNFGTSDESGNKVDFPTQQKNYLINVSSLRGDATCSTVVTVLPKVEIKNEIKSEEYLIEDKIILSDDLPKGRDVILDIGVIGKKEVTYKNTYTNNELTDSKRMDDEKIVVKPQNKIIKRGTKNIVQYYLDVSARNFKNNWPYYYSSFFILTTALVIFKIHKRK